MNYEILSKNRVGDHQWYITDYTKFKKIFQIGVKNIV